MKASNKWCPFSRAVYTGEPPVDVTGGGEIMVPHNRVYPHSETIGSVIAEGYCNCVATDCLAWRWFDPSSKNMDERRGYCGLAGKPEIPE